MRFILDSALKIAYLVTWVKDQHITYAYTYYVYMHYLYYTYYFMYVYCLMCSYSIYASSVSVTYYGYFLVWS